MERLFERDQRHREELDALIRLVAAFEDCERQVGKVICEFVGEDVEGDGEGGRKGKYRSMESESDDTDEVELDFGSIGEDVLEGTWFGWDD